MAHFLDDTVIDLLANGAVLNNDLNDVSYYIYNAGTLLAGNQPAAAGAALQNAGTAIDVFSSSLATANDSFLRLTRLGFALIRNNWPEGDAEELTWDTIIETYLNATDSHRMAWQLLLDAYQASMYDKPFDLLYHQTWVERFKEWR